MSPSILKSVPNTKYVLTVEFKVGDDESCYHECAYETYKMASYFRENAPVYWRWYEFKEWNYDGYYLFLKPIPTDRNKEAFEREMKMYVECEDYRLRDKWCISEYTHSSLWDHLDGSLYKYNGVGGP